MAREASLQELLGASFQSQINNVYTSIPCIVVGVNLTTSTVDIQPSINQKLKDGSVLERPVILGVPISFPVSKTAGITFPIEVGDTGMAVFSMRDMGAWKAGNGRPASPLNNAKMDKSDAIFIPGIQPLSVAVNDPAKRVLAHSTTDTVVVNNIGSGNEVEIRLTANGDIEINAPTKDVTVNCQTSNINANESVSVDAPDIYFFGNITHQGSYTAVGTMTFNGIDFGTHKHVGVDPGAGTSGGPTN
jgi:hypothetical protein